MDLSHLVFFLVLHILFPLSAATACTVSGQKGTCKNTNQACSGSFTPGHCPGQKNFQCCHGWGSCKVGGVSGTCQATNKKCSGTYTPGNCPGPKNIQCCTPKTGGGGGKGCPPRVNAATVALMKEFEGFVSRPKDDPTGNPTVGYGHKCQQKNCKEVTKQGYTFPLSRSEAASLLQKDLKAYESCLRSAIGKSKLNANQYGALVSWTYNMGCGNVKSSTLVSRIKKGHKVNTVCKEELPKWNKASKKVLPGLTRRRAAEAKLCRKKTSSKALPC